MKSEKRGILGSLNEYALMAVFISMIVVIALQIIARTFFNTAFAWVEEVGRYLFVILMLGGAAQAFRLGLWVNVDLFSSHLSKRGRIIMDMAINIMSLFFFVMIVYLSIVLFSRSGGQLTPALMVEVRYVYLAIPIFFGQITIFAIRRIVDDVWQLLGRGSSSKSPRS